ncbi:MAG: hypothetical protein KIT63_02600 [Rhodoferax sp.]|nr:hypothetical protein [Rhodoferax sp.]
MDTEKTVGLSFRVTPRLKHLLEAAAERERRSLTNTLEVLVEDYCERYGLGGKPADSPKKVGSKGKKGT